MNFQMFKLVLEKAEEPEIKLPTSETLGGTGKGRHWVPRLQLQRSDPRERTRVGYMETA